MGEQPEGHTLDRLSNFKAYGPENCKWSTPIEQANNKTTNMRIAFNGEEMTLAGWARKLKMNPRTLHNRLNACGWSVEKSLTTPLRGWNKSGMRDARDL